MNTPNFEGRELTQQECYQAGYEQGKRDAVPEDIRKDAERWRWAKENPDRAASVLENLGSSYFDSEVDKFISS